MPNEILLRELMRLHAASSEFQEAVKKELTFLSLPANHFLLDPPRVSEFIYFIVKGFAIGYTFSDEKKHVEWFWKANQLILAPRSLFEQNPSREFIQLVSNSELLCISYSGIQTLISNFPEATIVYKFIMNKYFESAVQRVRDFQQLDAARRFRKLLLLYPGIEQIVPQEIIASYLGVTPQSLSRIKRRKGDV